MLVVTREASMHNVSTACDFHRFMQMQQSTNSATDTRKGRLEDPRTEGISKQAKSNEGVTQPPAHAQKRHACDQIADKSAKNADAEVRSVTQRLHTPHFLVFYSLIYTIRAVR